MNNDFIEFDKAMSKVCECSHLRGEHSWSGSVFFSKGFDTERTEIENCNDPNCDCINFRETEDELVLKKCKERIAEEFHKMEAEKYE